MIPIVILISVAALWAIVLVVGLRNPKLISILDEAPSVTPVKLPSTAEFRPVGRYSKRVSHHAGPPRKPAILPESA